MCNSIASACILALSSAIVGAVSAFVDVWYFSFTDIKYHNVAASYGALQFCTLRTHSEIDIEDQILPHALGKSDWRCTNWDSMIPAATHAVSNSTVGIPQVFWGPCGEAANQVLTMVVVGSICAFLSTMALLYREKNCSCSYCAVLTRVAMLLTAVLSFTIAPFHLDNGCQEFNAAIRVVNTPARSISWYACGGAAGLALLALLCCFEQLCHVMSPSKWIKCCFGKSDDSRGTTGDRYNTEAAEMADLEAPLSPQLSNDVEISPLSPKEEAADMEAPLSPQFSSNNIEISPLHSPKDQKACDQI